MKQKGYEIWRHEGSKSWKIFIEMTGDLRSTLLNTGWKPVVQYKEGDAADDHGTCPEEVLRRISRGNMKS